MQVGLLLFSIDSRSSSGSSSSSSINLCLVQDSCRNKNIAMSHSDTEVIPTRDFSDEALCYKLKLKSLEHFHLPPTK